MKKSEFLEDVAHEINALKSNATKKELSRLNFRNFNPRAPQDCIYGQMTGSCATSRAKVLMNASCIRIFDTGNGEGVARIGDKTFSQIKEFINGSNDGQGWRSGNDRNYNYLSALEGYITLKGAKNRHIIKYLKGEIETLKL